MKTSSARVRTRAHTCAHTGLVTTEIIALHFSTCSHIISTDICARASSPSTNTHAGSGRNSGARLAQKAQRIFRLRGRKKQRRATCGRSEGQRGKYEGTLNKKPRSQQNDSIVVKTRTPESMSELASICRACQYACGRCTASLYCCSLSVRTGGRKCVCFCVGVRVVTNE